MKIVLRIILVIIFLPLFLQGQISKETTYTVIEVYTDPSIVEGDIITVRGYYTNNDYDYLMYFYGDFVKDTPFAPNTILTLTGIVPPTTAINGGYIEVTGIVTFAPVTDPYNKEDGLMAFINATTITVIFPRGPAPSRSGGIEKDNIEPEEYQPMDAGSCDSCKFAFLLSGGYNAANNHSKYWENLVALYKFKVDSLGYTWYWICGGVWFWISD